jgi:hypothetical protein
MSRLAAQGGNFEPICCWYLPLPSSPVGWLIELLPLHVVRSESQALSEPAQGRLSDR